MVIDVERARSETPGCADRVHLDNAGAALMTERVLSTQIDHLRLEGAIGGYEAAAQASEAIGAVYESIGRLIGSGPDHVAIVDSATTAWDLAFQSILLNRGDVILTAEVEYGANYVSLLKAVKDHGVVIEVIPSDEAGQADVAALKEAIDERTRLIAITHVPTNGGLVNPAEEIGAVARDAGVPYLLDAAQSIGQIDLSVDSLQCDFLVATGRKYLRGPRGTGFLYVGQAMLDAFEPPRLDHSGARWVARDRYELRSDAKRYEFWEFNYAAVLGLGAAVDDTLRWGLRAIEDRVTGLADTLRSKLQSRGFEVYDLGRRKCGIVTTTVPGTDPWQVTAELRRQGINSSVTTPESTRIDAERRGLPNLLRLSVHYFNTPEELDRTVSTLGDLQS